MWEILALLASAAVKANAANEVEKRQNDLARLNADYSKDRSDKALAEARKYFDRLKPESREAQSTQAKAELTQNLQDTVGAIEKFAPPQVTQGRVSDAYTKRVASGGSDNTKRLNDAIARLSVIGAPAQVSLDDQSRFGQAALAGSGHYDAASSVADAYQNAIARVRPNPLKQMLAEGLDAYGVLGGNRSAGTGIPANSQYSLSYGRPSSSIGLRPRP